MSRAFPVNVTKSDSVGRRSHNMSTIPSVSSASAQRAVRLMPRRVAFTIATIASGSTPPKKAIQNCEESTHGRLPAPCGSCGTLG